MGGSGIDTIVSQESEAEYAKTGKNMNEYKETVRKVIETEVRNLIDKELRKASQELLDEQKKAIRQLVEEHRLVIREAVEEEKKAIWSRLEELRESILKLGLG